MSLHLFSISHDVHGLDEVARAATLTEDLAPALLAHPGVNGIIRLSTCNRVEIYLSVCGSACPASPEVILSHLTQTPLPWHVATGMQVVKHLFAVCAGLNSMVMGEREISGQVRRALTVAAQEGWADATLTRLFNQALSTSRKVAHLTGLGAMGRSVVSVGLDLASAAAATAVSSASPAPSLPPAKPASAAPFSRVLLIGTGSYAGATVAQLRSRGVMEIHSYSASTDQASRERARRFAQGHDLIAVSGDDLEQALGTADLIVTCRGLGTPVFSAAQLATARENAGKNETQHANATGQTQPQTQADPQKATQAAPLVILDLAVNPDVPAEAGRLEGVKLLGLADVQGQVPALAGGQIARAEEIVAAGVEDLRAELEERRMDPVVTALRGEFESAVEAEIKRLPQGRDGLISRESAEAALRHLAARLVHGPTVNAQSAASTGRAHDWARSLQAVWGIEAQPEESALATSPFGIPLPSSQTPVSPARPARASAVNGGAWLGPGQVPGPATTGNTAPSSVLNTPHSSPHSSDHSPASSQLQNSGHASAPARA